jgi:hypothetical protein
MKISIYDGRLDNDVTQEKLEASARKKELQKIANDNIKLRARNQIDRWNLS